MTQRAGIDSGHARSKPPFQDVVSQIFGPGKAVLHPPRWNWPGPRWVALCVGAWRAAPPDFIWRVLTVLALVGLTVGVGIKLGHQPRPLLTVAEVGMCFIAPHGGAKWHSVRECRALARAPHIEQVTLAAAAARGKKTTRWQSPCERCGGMLRRVPEFRAKREEFEMLSAAGAPD